MKDEIMSDFEALRENYLNSADKDDDLGKLLAQSMRTAVAECMVIVEKRLGSYRSCCL
jgi:hypothetical protein